MKPELKRLSVQLLVGGAVFALALKGNHFLILLGAGAWIVGVVHSGVSRYLFPKSGRLFEPKDRS